MGDLGDGARDRGIDRVLHRKLRDGRGRRDPFGRDLRQRLAATYGDACRVVPGLLGGRGQYEIAEAREPRKGRRLGAKAGGDARDLGHSPGDERSAGAVAEACANGDARGQGHDILQRPAELRAAYIGRAVKTKRRGGEAGLQGFANRRVGAGERERRGQAAGKIPGKTRARERRRHRTLTVSFDDLRGPFAGFEVDALHAGNENRGGRRPRLLEKVPECLHRDREKLDFGRNSVEFRGYEEVLGQVEPGQTRSRPAGSRHLGGGRAVARPECHLAARARQGYRQRGSESSGAEDCDAAHAFAPFRPAPMSGAWTWSSGQRGRAMRARSLLCPASFAALSRPARMVRFAATPPATAKAGRAGLVAR